MKLFEYLPEGLIDFIEQLFMLVPIGFLLGMLCGILAFAIFGLFGLLRQVIR